MGFRRVAESLTIHKMHSLVSYWKSYLVNMYVMYVEKIADFSKKKQIFSNFRNQRKNISLRQLVRFVVLVDSFLVKLTQLEKTTLCFIFIFS